MRFNHEWTINTDAEGAGVIAREPAQIWSAVTCHRIPKPMAVQ